LSTFLFIDDSTLLARDGSTLFLMHCTALLLVLSIIDNIALLFLNCLALFGRHGRTFPFWNSFTFFLGYCGTLLFGDGVANRFLHCLALLFVDSRALLSGGGSAFLFVNGGALLFRHVHTLLFVYH